MRLQRHHLLTACLATHGIAGVLSQACEPQAIHHAADAATLRSCKTVTGPLYIGAVSEDADTVIDLDGIESITGDFGTPGVTVQTGEDVGKNPRVSIVSSTLREVGGDLFFSDIIRVVNVTVPRLKSVGGKVFFTGEELEYVDITDLESVGEGDFQVLRTGLKELKHGGLRDMGRGADDVAEDFDFGHGIKQPRRGIVVEENPFLASVDSLTGSPVRVGLVQVRLNAALKKITLGAAFAWRVVVVLNNLPEIVLGSEQARDMYLGFVQVQGSSSFTAHSALRNATAGIFKTENNTFTRLDVPFAALHELSVQREDNLTWITIPAEAENYEDFSLMLDSNMNLSSEYTPDKDGGWVKSWHWPKGDMGEVKVWGHVGTAFL